jgi:hypothetical protein
MGAIAGGAAGNAIGNGGGRALTTMIGLVGGAMVGDRIEGPNNQLQNVQQCNTQTFYENRTSHYNVVYEYQGVQYNAQMPTDPGLHVRLRVAPVGALESGPQPFQPQTQASQQPQPQAYYPPVQPVYAQPQPVYVQPQPVYVQPAMAAPVYYPGYYPRPYYAPIGLSLNFGYSRGFGGGYSHHGR